ncbi:FAD-dependent monooxygenase [Solirubrobacter sp. CPCC 204708]|uniref:FAD-dependent monooxygenase n=1 Tax=Solirubrobacter deserti TaxID=2282478 RepID=A0ABT4RSM9_9ACTN|nr:FAD-dependent monooxygenase [Solirubrobacter deserti]MBE2315923.1 FAD-dependent monooxygenase [Solirubrobacter deserti]MDA0141603.1 FAD-dependent monooxygenase [Solirubrobacter deserti]
MHAVAIVGSGPAGMMLAAELALAGVEPMVLERRATPELESARSGGLQARTIEVLDLRGVGERFVSQGQAAQVVHFPVPLDISDFPSRRPYGLALWQNKFEAILREWVTELGVTVERGCEVTGLTQHDDGVDLELAGGRTVRAQYVLGCDGGRSAVRKLAGIEFPGWDPASSSLVAEAKIADESEVGNLRRDDKGVYAIGKLDDGYARMVVREDELGRTSDPTLEDLRGAMIAVWGSDFGVHEPRWISRFTDTSRQAANYRAGRVLLAGDAAHVHSPVGGQGLNTGVQDAFNLGWKLAAVVKGEMPDTLLDSYHDERHPVGARVIQQTMAMTSLNLGDPRSLALRDTIAEVMAFDEPRRFMAGALSGLDIHYDLGEGHPLLGRRMPDLELTGGGTVYELLHTARPVLLNFGGAPLEAGVRVVDAAYDGPWELPVIGEVAAPSAVLVRPDGHVAWVGEDGSDAGLADAVTRWFG